MNNISKRCGKALAVSLIGALLPVMSIADTSTNSSTPDSSLVIGGGCFWCLEALFETLDGVSAVKSGYAGGMVDNPSYREVCSGSTGHAEVVRVDFDPDEISLTELLEFFWEAHDPTTLNRQGADTGTQYRSIILFNSPDQKVSAEASLKAAQKVFSQPIVTEIKELEKFYPAEIQHQDYYKNNPNAPYCQYVIAPKLRKLES